jgi:hypothetical protein
MSRPRLSQREFNWRAMQRKRARQMRAKVAILELAGGRCMNCGGNRLQLIAWKNGLAVCQPCLDKLEARCRHSDPPGRSQTQTALPNTPTG